MLQIHADTARSFCAPCSRISFWHGSQKIRAIVRGLDRLKSAIGALVPVALLNPHNSRMERNSKANRTHTLDRVVPVSSFEHGWLDFAIWDVATSLVSSDLARLGRVSRACCEALRHDVFWPKLLESRQQQVGATDSLRSLAHLHIAETLFGDDQRIIFTICSCSVPAEALMLLQFLAKLLQQHPRAQVAVEGHTTHGPPDLMEHYSQGRAEAVAVELHRLGVRKNQIKVSWFRNERLLHPQSGMHPENRRVELFVELDDIRFPLSKEHVIT